MRRAARVDANQRIIVDGLRAAGASVQSLAAIGKGCPDLVVGYQGKNFLLEVKDGAKPRWAQALTPDQEGWWRTWDGQVCVVRSLEDALAAIGVM